MKLYSHLLFLLLMVLYSSAVTTFPGETNLSLTELCGHLDKVIDETRQMPEQSLNNPFVRVKQHDFSIFDRYVDLLYVITQKTSPIMLWHYSWQLDDVHLVTPVLNANYRNALLKAHVRLIWLFILVSLQSFFLLGIIVYVQHKRRQLAKARNALHNINLQLESLNHKLSDSNEHLRQAYQQLSDANRMKDEYIGRFLSTCSEYIGKLDRFRSRVNRKLKARQYADLLKMTESNQLKIKEQQELYKNFDHIFLNLFPNFVNDFNALLAPEYRIKVEHRGQLTTDLRIFALIRLGIDESARIAELLGYSPNSIYNYRSRIKNKALCSRDDFERRVKEIEM